MYNLVPNKKYCKIVNTTLHFNHVSTPTLLTYTEKGSTKIKTMKIVCCPTGRRWSGHQTWSGIAPLKPSSSRTTIYTMNKFNSLVDVNLERLVTGDY